MAHTNDLTVLIENRLRRPTNWVGNVLGDGIHADGAEARRGVQSWPQSSSRRRSDEASRGRAEDLSSHFEVESFGVATYGLKVFDWRS